MRTIKFRAWDEGGKRYEGREVCLIGELVIKSSYSATRWKEEAQLFNLCTSTGLKDEFGEESYEGDIIEFTFEYGREKDTGVIKYLDHRAYFVVESKERSYVLGNCWDFKIIGNIYEDKELLERL